MSERLYECCECGHLFPWDHIPEHEEWHTCMEIGRKAAAMLTVKDGNVVRRDAIEDHLVKLVATGVLDATPEEIPRLVDTIVETTPNTPVSNPFETVFPFVGEALDDYYVWSPAAAEPSPEPLPFDDIWD